MTTTDISSRQVAWHEVFEYVDRLLTHSVGSRPTAGTPAWCELDDDDPAKLAAVLDAGVLWSLRIDTEQEQRAQAGRDVHGGEDWRRRGGRILQHSQSTYIPRRKTS